MKKFIVRNLFTGLLISLGFCGGIFLLTKAASLTATSGTPLTASNWNTMITNFFWGSGSGGIFYNGKVGIGTSSPNKALHVYDTTNNAEIDIQSVVGSGKHWAIYQDAASQELRMRNGFDRVKVTTGGNLNAQGLCINGVCKTDWNQVGGGGILNYTGTCDLEHKGAGGIFNGEYKICNGSIWRFIASVTSYFDGAGTISDPYRKSGESINSTNVIATSCNYYNLNATTLNNGNTRGSGTCGGLNACLNDGVYLIDPDGVGGNNAFQVYCDMNQDGGGWTLIMKSAANDNTFNYSSTYWANDTVLNQSDVSLTQSTSKYLSYSLVTGTLFKLNLSSTRTNRIIYNNGTSISGKNLFSSTANSSTSFDISNLNIGEWTPGTSCTASDRGGAAVGNFNNSGHRCRFCAKRVGTSGGGYSSYGLGIKTYWTGGACDGDKGSPSSVQLWVK